MIAAIVIIVLLFIVLMILKFTDKKNKGKNEKVSGSKNSLVRSIIGETAKKKRYVLHDYAVDADGESGQIDHIVINKRGLYAIQVREWKGRIYGSEEQETWVQVLRHGKVKNVIENSVRLNKKYMQQLGKIIGQSYMYSLIVFVNAKTSDVWADQVVDVKGLKKALKRGEDKYTREQMKEMYEKLKENQEQNEVVEEEKLDNKKKRKKEKKRNRE